MNRAMADRPVAVVTGATGGIGRWIALGLARKSYHVVMMGRDAARTAAGAAWLQNQVADASLETRLADLSSLAETRALGNTLLQAHPRLSLLVTNAGIFAHRREVTSEGHEKVLATNHLSPFLLTNMLLPALRRAGQARIITIGSDTSDRGTIDPANLELTRGWNFVRAYRRSKLAQMMTVFELAERLRGSGVTANVVHPGAVATGLVRTPGVIGVAWQLMAPFLLTEEQGAATPLYAALAANVGGMTGFYFKKQKPVRPNLLALDPAWRQAVWTATEQCLAEFAG